MPLTVDTPLCGSRSPIGFVDLNAKWLSENITIRRMCNRKLMDLFKDRAIGARPMYRHDILFDSNVILLEANLKKV